VQVLLDDYVAAAAVATDLVNTTAEVAVSSGDQLSGVVQLERFLAEHDLVLEALADGRRVTSAELAAVHRLRRTVREIIDSAEADGGNADGGKADSGEADSGEAEGGEADSGGGDRAAAAAGRLVSTHGAGPTLVRVAGGAQRWQVRSRPGCGVAGELAVLLGTGLLGVLHVLGPGRFRQCASPACRGAFVDVSRGGRRRYCVPEICGNRINVANHRARRRAAGS
jgi:CGNR zinc finger/Putative stress-induced transcription regulator